QVEVDGGARDLRRRSGARLGSGDDDIVTQRRHAAVAQLYAATLDAQSAVDREPIVLHGYRALAGDGEQEARLLHGCELLRGPVDCRTEVALSGGRASCRGKLALAAGDGERRNLELSSGESRVQHAVVKEDAAV